MNGASGAARRDASPHDRGPQRYVADAEDETGGDELPHPVQRALAEVGREKVLPALQQKHGRAEERREKPGHAQPSGPLELAGEDAD